MEAIKMIDGKAYIQAEFLIDLIEADAKGAVTVAEHISENRDVQRQFQTGRASAFKFTIARIYELVRTGTK